MNIDPGTIVSILLLLVVGGLIFAYYRRQRNVVASKAGGEYKHRMPKQSGPDRTDAYED